MNIFKFLVRLFLIIVLILHILPNKLLSQKVPDLDRAKSVKSKKLDKLDSFLNTPYRMSLIFSERYLAITDIDNFPSVHIIKFNSENDYEYYKGMGNEGRGPAEYLSPSDVISDMDYFYVFDSGNLKFVKYNSNFEVVSNEIINLRTDGLPVSVHKYEDTFLLAGINIGSKFEIADLDGKVVSKGGKDLSLGNNIPSRSLALAWHSYSAFSDEKRKIAIFSIIVNSDGDLLTTQLYPEPAVRFVELIDP